LPPDPTEISSVDDTSPPATDLSAEIVEDINVLMVVASFVSPRA
jgi:hypothetical protein